MTMLGDMRRSRIFGYVASCLLLFVAIFGMSMPASAQFDPLEQACQGAGSSPACGADGGTNPIVGEEGIVTRVTRILATVTAIVSVIIIIIAGMTMVLSSGNSQQVQSSRDAIIYAAVALAVAVLAQAVVTFVLSNLT